MESRDVEVIIARMLVGIMLVLLALSAANP